MVNVIRVYILARYFYIFALHTRFTDELTNDICNFSDNYNNFLIEQDILCAGVLLQRKSIMCSEFQSLIKCRQRLSNFS